MTSSVLIYYSLYVLQIKNKDLKQLAYYYLAIVILSVILIAPTHIFSPPLFMPLRFPYYLEKMQPFLGVAWPATFKIYHYVLYILSIVGVFNILGVFYYPKFKRIAIFSCWIGVFLLSAIFLFFLFVFIKINLSTSIIYGFYSLILLLIDKLTLKVLFKKQKEAST